MQEHVELRRPRPGTESRWWRGVAVAAGAALAAALGVLSLAGLRTPTSPSTTGPGFGLSAAARAALGSLVGDTTELDDYRQRVVKALERHRDGLPSGSADALLQNLEMLDGTIEQMVGELQRHPTDLRLIGLLVNAYRQEIDILQHAGRLLEGSGAAASALAADPSKAA